LEHCVGTTYTLHLTSALLPPLAFSSLGLGSTHDPVAILTVLREVGNRIDLFCQAGQIAVPRQSSALLALLEKTVHQMRPPRPGHLFHPKVWVCKYVPDLRDHSGDGSSDGTDACYRLLVLSRNLTDDSCWDTVVSLDGTLGTRPYADNRPLAEFLRYLTRDTVHQLEPQRLERITALAEEIRRVQWVPPEGLDLMAFHALGVSRTPMPDFSGSRSLVISPFLTGDGLALTAPTGEISVVSTAEALDQLDLEAADWIDTALVISPDADLREPAEGRPDVPSNRGAQILTGLHAKIYAVERNRRVRLFVGSANATGPAFAGNVEFLVEFEGRTKDVGVAALLGKDALGAITVPYPKPFGGVVPSDDDLARKRLDQAIRAIAAVPATATVTEDGDTYRVTVSTAGTVPLPDAYRATAQLHTVRGRAVDIVAGEPLHAVYTDIRLADITALVIITVASPEGLEGGCVVVADLVGDPPARFDAIIASQLDTPEKFLRFLALLLGLTGDASLMLGADGAAAGRGAGRYLSAGLFEQLLAGLADNREALRSLDAIIDRMSENPDRQRLLPVGFAEFWLVVRQALATLEGDKG
jgi:hypothetical protein